MQLETLIGKSASDASERLEYSQEVCSVCFSQSYQEVAKFSEGVLVDVVTIVCFKVEMAGQSRGSRALTAQTEDR